MGFFSKKKEEHYLDRTAHFKAEAEVLKKDKKVLEDVVRDLEKKIVYSELAFAKKESEYTTTIYKLKAELDRPTVTVDEHASVKCKVDTLTYERDMYKKMVDTLQELPQLSKIYEKIADLKLPSLKEVTDISDSLKNAGKVTLSEDSVREIGGMVVDYVIRNNYTHRR